MSQRLGRNNNSISLLEKKGINGLRTEQHQQETNKDFSLESRAETGMQPLASTLPTLVNLNFFCFKYLDIAFCSQGSRLQKRLVVIHTSSVHVHSWFITQNYSSLQFPLCGLLWKQLTGFHSTFPFQLLMREPKLNQNVVNLKLIIAQAESNNLLYLIMNKCE